MKHSARDFDLALNAAIGDEPALAGDLRCAFRDSVAVHRAALDRTAEPQRWRETAARLQGLAASFGALTLMRAAGAAADGPVRDPGTLAVIDQAIAQLG